MKRFCIDVEAILSADLAGWDEGLLAKRTICVPYRDGLETILDTQKHYGAAEIIRATYPIFYGESVQFEKEYIAFTGGISEPAKYQVATRIVEEPVRDSTPENKGKRGICDFYGLLKRTKEFGMLPK